MNWGLIIKLEDPWMVAYAGPADSEENRFELGRIHAGLFHGVEDVSKLFTATMMEAIAAFVRETYGETAEWDTPVVVPDISDCAGQA